ncbi:hypothetical protein AGABI1DRAFT_112574 [Agaricus bisporus var. burnettii JB137-S8]|uniref:Amidohydrolase 3 domain-containing protein n=1 Tax=Agaricus bisporus var. burnettii (strain JB137-S8 / ATCC MYA-4627 / FGSC 10392) TaxID=597362 RepID=K5XCK1_AGABU|nr:uncharacterized protein AGABI1DRAFT_112574 [Agaricus bisporus var. burnettii JB137-S8]EKM80842.1 hypothetical protein AGABI1DRAFT_112574 [Agaricus bisporus var. burnettii JB137-S8]
MLPQQPPAISDSAVNGTKASNVTGQKKMKANGIQAPKVTKAKSRFFGRFGALIGLTSLWAAIRYSNWAPVSSYALCSREGDFIYTVDQNNTNVQCVVVQGAHISHTGSLSDLTGHSSSYPILGAIAQVFARPSLEIRFIPPGSIVVPGVSDSHAHILEYGASHEIPFEGSPTIADAVSRVRDAILNDPDTINNKTKWIRGSGWDHTVWSSLPSAGDLDADPYIRGRPVVLQSKDYHAVWVSREVIRLSLPLPDSVEGGVIVRDESGQPTGVFLDNAIRYIKQPDLTNDDLRKRFKIAVDHAYERGLTSIHDAGLDPVSLAFFKEQADNGLLPIRIYGMRHFNPNEAFWGNSTEIIIGTDEYRLTARSVKIFADGALRTGGAALYEPYYDNPDTSGFMRLDDDILFDAIRKFLQNGWQVNVHAIGDRANGLVLDAFEASLKGVNVTALRPRLEHAQMMTRNDMKRLGKLGVIASVQPTHAISDMWYAQDRLGPERVKLLYAFRSIIDSGARITFGSDFPVESMNPLSAFYAAITRVSPDGKSPHGPNGWFPEERLSRVEALRGMTIDPAYSSFTEDILGSIEAGKRADFTIFSRDIMTIPVDSILNTQVVATVIDGKTVYGTLDCDV